MQNTQTVAASFSNQELIDLVSRGDQRAVARLITLAENRVPRVREVQAALFKRGGKAQVIGVTGSPGAGKSTLVDQLAATWKARGKKVAIVAVDPTSPFSGGAILGDRIRMTKASEESGIFIRSMATRGKLGGLSRATLDAVQILDAAGFDLIFVETVGVGQAEVDIVRLADTCLVVLVPGMGDSVQAFKAGILEIADAFVINKSDREGADILQKDLRILMSLGDYAPGDWQPPIVRSVATTGEGVGELADAIGKHLEWLRQSPAGKSRKIGTIRETIVKIATEVMIEKVMELDPVKLDQLVERCYLRELDPYSVVDELLR